MADKSAIEWTDATWNPVVGCSILSPGCINCFAMKMAARIERMHAGKTHYAGTTQSSKAGAVWTGKVALAPDHIVMQPLHWKRGRRIFVNSMGDLFHESIPDGWIDKVFVIMALSPQHTFQVLTKRAARMQKYVSAFDLAAVARYHAPSITQKLKRTWPLSNVWLGVSTERQQEADERIPLLMQTPAAVRFISAEPLLGPINLRAVTDRVNLEGGYDLDVLMRHPEWAGDPRSITKGAALDWVIVGGESGPGARPMHPDWARSLRDQCAVSGVPFFMKQMTKKAAIPADLLVREFPDAA